ncbi:hypothetical protein TNCV_1208121 [Trichonephila clavipes]|nr:hypothetical protein TNCV_1208121 [Trichonephila clavipes]
MTSREKNVVKSRQKLCERGHVGTHSACIWSIENAYEVPESQQDSPKLDVSVPSHREKCMDVPLSEKHL